MTDRSAGDHCTVYQCIARSVFDHGVRTMFGLMGDANLFMADSFASEQGGTFVPFAHEAGCVLAALAYARVSDRPAVATITHGPALTNSMTALVEGVRARTSIVLLAGDTAVEMIDNPQNIDQRELVAATGAGFEQMRSPNTAIVDIARAFSRARIERRPIVLNMPSDFMWEKVEYRRFQYPVFDAPSLVPQGDNFDQAIGIIASAKRPIVLAGDGARGAKDALTRLAERLEAPLATTLPCKDLFHDHPANIGIYGTLSTPPALDVIAKSDVVVAFGASLNLKTTDRGKLFEGKRVVQIDTEADAIGRKYVPKAALVADAGLTADNIIHWLDEAEIEPSGFSKELASNIATQYPTAKSDETLPGHINLAFALDWLDDILPEDKIVVFDGGRFVTEAWCRMSTLDPRYCVNSTRFASIGLGLQMAIGAGHAASDKPVVLVTGDGGFMAGGITEFNTAVRTGVDLVVVVCNDGAYGAEHIQFADRQMDPSLSHFEWPSLADVATSLGGRGVRVTSAGDLDAAMQAIKTRGEPLLIDLVLHPDHVTDLRL